MPEDTSIDSKDIDIRDESKKLLWTSGRSFYAVALLFMAFFLVNSSNWFGARLDTNSILIYAFLPIFLMFILGVKPEALDDMVDLKLSKKWKPTSLVSQSFYVIMGIFATMTIMMVMYNVGYGSFGTTPKYQAFGLLSYLLISVAVSEEIIFRGILPHVINKRANNLLVAWIISQGAFALFHGAVYSWNVQTMFTAFIIGSIWFFVSRRYGLAMTIGSHFAYNGCVTGILVWKMTGGIPTGLMVVMAIGLLVLYMMNKSIKKVGNHTSTI